MSGDGTSKVLGQPALAYVNKLIERGDAAIDAGSTDAVALIKTAAGNLRTQGKPGGAALLTDLARALTHWPNAIRAEVLRQAMATAAPAFDERTGDWQESVENAVIVLHVPDDPKVRCSPDGHGHRKALQDEVGAYLAKDD